MPADRAATTTARRGRFVPAGPTRGRGALGAIWLIGTRLGALVLLLQAYTAFRKRYFLQPATEAFDHALDLMALQATLRIDIELGMQRWALAHPWTIDIANAYYRALKPTLYASAVLALLLAPVAARRIGTAVLLATLIAWPWYALYPLAPPRFMGEFGFSFVDTLAATTATAVPPGAGANPYAAMPSMHIAWTALAALWLAAALPWRRIGAVLGALHLGMMSLAVLVTGNHYLLDIVAGLGVAAAGLVLARLRSAFPLWRRQPQHGRGPA